MPMPPRPIDWLFERERITTGLRELIAALDRRVPRVDRAAERGIADDAAALRREAVHRLEHLDDRTAR